MAISTVMSNSKIGRYNQTAVIQTKTSIKYVLKNEFTPKYWISSDEPVIWWPPDASDEPVIWWPPDAPKNIYTSTICKWLFWHQGHSESDISVSCIFKLQLLHATAIGNWISK